MADYEQMYQQLSTEPGTDTMDFTITRPAERAEPGKTMSAEALDELNTALKVFVGARVAYHWAAREGGTDAVGPMSIRAEVKLTIDGRHVEPDPDRRPWFVIDGQRRND